MPGAPASNPPRQTDGELHQLFARLADEELASRVASGALTDAAHALAIAELGRRGLAVPEIRQSPAAPPADYLGDQVILERNLSPTEAHLMCACLHAAGIEADAGDTHIVQAHSLLALALGGASVRVPSAQLPQAREIIAAFRRGDFALGDDFDPGDGSAPA